MSSLISRYLNTMAAEWVQPLAARLAHPLDAILVVPAFDEAYAALQSFLTHPTTRNLAVILVINAPEHAAQDALQRTRKLVQTICAQHGMCTGKGESNVELADTRSLFLIDRTAEGALLPKKEGVGLARKLGLDLALALSERSRQHFGQGVRWLHSTDADVRLPEDYFSLPALPEESSAVVYPFTHRAEPGFEQAMRLYEFKLHYYVNGLQWAGSPYAYHTIGSTLAVCPKAYAQARGVPRRAGGEDFYLLNKLAKLGPVMSLQAPQLEICGRPSERVPFGTGPALGAIRNMDDALEQYGFYHPACFEALQLVLRVACAWSETPGNAATFRAMLSEHAKDENLAERIWLCLSSLKSARFFKHIQTQRPKNTLQHFHHWFDAFLTLKFIHALRADGYNDLNVRELSRYHAALPVASRDALALLLNEEELSLP